MGDYRKAAVDWARRGFRVFPLASGSKKPLTDGWTETATADPLAVARTWTDSVTGWARDYNVGVLTDDMIVVDIDQKNGKDGLSSFMALDLPLETLLVRTPTGGRHAYFSGPSKSLSVGKLGEGLDIRSYHGYVVAPGSQTPEGHYVLENDAPVLPAPPHLLARLDEPRARAAAPALAEQDADGALDRAVEYLQQRAPLAIEGRGGDAETYAVACVLRDYGVSERTAVLLMLEHWNERCSPPWPSDELAAKVENAFAYAKSPAGILSPEADAPTAIIDPPAPPLVVPSGPWLRHGDPVPMESFLYDQLLPREGVSLLFGPSNSGKSFLTIELARSLATGKPFFGTSPEERGGTIFLFGGTEGSGFLGRLAALKEDGHLPISARQVGSLQDKGALGEIAAAVQEESRWLHRERGVQARLLIVETLSATGLVVDEDSNAEAGLAIANLAQLGRLCGCTVLFTHHPTKDGRGHRGAGAFRDNVDYVLEIERNGKAELRELALVKARNAPQRALGAFTLLPVEVGTDEKGRPVKSMEISMSAARTLGAGDGRKNREPPHAALIMECVEWAIADAGKDYRAKDGLLLGDVRDVFKDRKPGSKDSSNTKKSFEAAVSWLEEHGRIAVRSDGTDKFIVVKEKIE